MSECGIKMQFLYFAILFPYLGICTFLDLDTNLCSQSFANDSPKLLVGQLRSAKPHNVCQFSLKINSHLCWFEIIGPEKLQT